VLAALELGAESDIVDIIFASLNCYLPLKKLKYNMIPSRFDILSKMDALDKAVQNYRRNKTYTNFIKITKHVKPEMVRGGVKKVKTDFCNTDVTDLALVYRGFKPICWICEEDLATEKLIAKLGLKMIQFLRYQCHAKEPDQHSVVWKSDDQDDRAMSLVNLLITYDYDKRTEKDYHQFVGESLGFHQKDIDCYLALICK
jgi:hypothetical protein